MNQTKTKTGKNTKKHRCWALSIRRVSSSVLMLFLVKDIGFPTNVVYALHVQSIVEKKRQHFVFYFIWFFCHNVTMNSNVNVVVIRWTCTPKGIICHIFRLFFSCSSSQVKSLSSICIFSIQTWNWTKQLCLYIPQGSGKSGINFVISLDLSSGHKICWHKLTVIVVTQPFLWSENDRKSITKINEFFFPKYIKF